MTANASYQPKVYRKQGGDELVVASGGKINIETGGTILVNDVDLIDEIKALSGVDITEMGYIDGVTAGTVLAGKAVVTTTDKHIDTLVISDGGLKLGTGAGTAITSTAAELNYNDITAAGTVEASKTVVVDANKDISAFRTISATGLSLASTSPVSHPINLEALTLASDCNVIRGASINPTRTSGWISFSGTVSATPAQVYTDYRNLTTTGVAEVLGIGSFPMMATGASCKSMFASQFICQVDTGATVLTAAAAPGTGIYPLVAKALIDGATVNSGAQIAAAWLSVQANVTDISGHASAIVHMEVASGTLRDIFYVNATAGNMATNFLNFSASASPVLSWGADAQPNAAAADLGLRCKVGAVEYWIPLYVNT